MKWLIRKIDPAESVSLALETTLLKTTVKYPVRRVQIKTLQVEANRRDTPTTTLFNGQIPRRLVICCVDNDAFHGSYTKSPFNFKHFNASSIQVTAGGVNFPPNPLLMDYARNLYTRPFVQMYEALGHTATHKSCWLDFEDYSHGNAFYVFDLSPDSSDDAHWELIREGATTIQMTFSEAIPAGGMKLVVLAEYDNLITVDRFRNVYFDYTP
jgi:ribonucleoside-diphosphate reductase beta chain